MNLFEQMADALMRDGTAVMLRSSNGDILCHRSTGYIIADDGNPEVRSNIVAFFDHRDFDDDEMDILAVGAFLTSGLYDPPLSWREEDDFAGWDGELYYLTDQTVSSTDKLQE